MICNHNVVLVDSYHYWGVLATCLECEEGITLSTNDMEERTPFAFVSPEGKDADRAILVRTIILETL